MHELDDRRVAVGLLGEGARLGLGLRLVLVVNDVFDRILHPRQPGQQQVEILDRGDRHAHSPAGDHRDVVDRQHVRRVGHRQQQRAVVDEPDRHGPVALGGVGADQLHGAHVQVVDRQVDVVQAEPLGHDSRQLVGAQHALRHQHFPRGLALLAGDPHRLFDGVAVGEPEIDDHFADHPARAPGLARGIDALSGALALAPLLQGQRTLLLGQLQALLSRAGELGGDWHGDISHQRPIGILGTALDHELR